MDNQWERDQPAARRGGTAASEVTSTFKLPDKVRASHDFDAKLTAAVGTPDYKVSRRAWMATIRRSSRSSSTSSCRRRASSTSCRWPPGRAGSAADEWDWDNVYEIVAAAHREKVYAPPAGRAAHPARSRASPATTSVKALAAMLAKVLDAEAPDESALQRFVDESLPRLDAFGVSSGELAYLKSVAARSEPAPDWARDRQSPRGRATQPRERFKDPVAAEGGVAQSVPAGDARAAIARVGDRGCRGAATVENVRSRRAESASPTPLPQPIFGWAIGSPLLALARARERSC